MIYIKLKWLVNLNDGENVLLAYSLIFSSYQHQLCIIFVTHNNQLIRIRALAHWYSTCLEKWFNNKKRLNQGKAEGGIILKIHLNYFIDKVYVC